jgi:hypothetical protein
VADLSVERLWMLATVPLALASMVLSALVPTVLLAAMTGFLMAAIYCFVAVTGSARGRRAHR